MWRLSGVKKAAIALWTVCSGAQRLEDRTVMRFLRAARQTLGVDLHSYTTLLADILLKRVPIWLDGPQRIALQPAMGGLSRAIKHWRPASLTLLRALGEVDKRRARQVLA